MKSESGGSDPTTLVALLRTASEENSVPLTGGGLIGVRESHIVAVWYFKERDYGEKRVSNGSSARVCAPILYRSPLAIGSRKREVLPT